MSKFDVIARYGVVPVISIENEKDALPLADVLISAVLPVAEITLRTKEALAAIAQIARHRPDMLVGAGTILVENQLEAVQSAEAKFALSPGIDVATLSAAKMLGFPRSSRTLMPVTLKFPRFHAPPPRTSVICLLHPSRRPSQLGSRTRAILRRRTLGSVDVQDSYLMLSLIQGCKQEESSLDPFRSNRCPVGAD